MQRLHGALNVGGRNAEGAVGKLFVNAAAVGQDQYAVAVVDHRAFLGHQVHALDYGVHQEHVVELHAGDGLSVIVLDEGHDGLPVVGAVVIIDLLHHLLYLVHVPLVLTYVGAGRHQESEEFDLALQLRVASQHQFIGPEAADDVLVGLDAVDTDDRSVAGVLCQPCFIVQGPWGVGDALHLLHVDGDGVDLD